MASEAFEKWWPNLTGNGKSVGERAWAAAVEACAAELETAGCACAQLVDENFAEQVMLAVEPHNSACPYALAARLRRLA